MPELQELKFDLDIILYICDIIENNIKQTETKSIDKKQIVIGILQKCHSFSTADLVILNKMIEFLHSNHLITKITKIEKTGNKILGWALKKIIWNGINYALDYFEFNFYKKIKSEVITTVLIKLCLNKEIVMLIIAFI